jgi:hypothetical protein
VNKLLTLDGLFHDLSFENKPKELLFFKPKSHAPFLKESVNDLSEILDEVEFAFSFDILPESLKLERRVYTVTNFLADLGGYYGIVQPLI